MTFLKSEFKLLDRRFQDTLLLVPGWAVDYRIFDSLDLDFNYLIPAPLSLYDFEDALTGSLKKLSLNKISILGWSLGGYLAANFASNYPEYVKEITLLGMRKKYDAQGLEKVKELVKKNAAAYLYKFYRDCLLSEGKKYISLFKEANTDELLEGLDYLGRARLDSAALKNVKIKFIHGECDKIAPMEEIKALKEDFPDAKFIIVKGAGHAPFLKNDFRKAFYEQ